MAAESMLLPVPSEAVMPFAGFLVSAGQFDFWTVAVLSALGCLFGSLLSYAIGYYGALPLVERYGKYVLVEKKHLTWTERYFAKHGSITVFVCRFIPVVRHISSIPAGAARMNLWTFSLYSLAGAFLWNTFLLWLGVQLGAQWTTISQYTKILDVIVIVCLGAAVIYLAHKLRKFRR